MENHVMIGLETLGRGPDAVIVAVAAVAFDPYGDIKVEDEGSRPVLDSRHTYCVIDLQESMNRGFSIDPGVIKWWMAQSAEKRDHLVRSGRSIRDALSSVDLVFDFALHTGNGNPGGKCRPSNPVYVWSCSDGFDRSSQLTVLASYFRSINTTLLDGVIPKDSRDIENVRSVETAVAMAGYPEVERLDGAPENHALWDAVHNVRLVQAAFRSGVREGGKGK